MAIYPNLFEVSVAEDKWVTSMPTNLTVFKDIAHSRGYGTVLKTLGNYEKNAFMKLDESTRNGILEAAAQTPSGKMYSRYLGFEPISLYRMGDDFIINFKKIKNVTDEEIEVKTEIVQDHGL